MISPLVDALGWTLIHFVWQAVVVGAILTLALRLTKARYAAATIALLSLPVVAVATCWVQVSALSSTELKSTVSLVAGLETQPSTPEIYSPDYEAADFIALAGEAASLHPPSERDEPKRGEGLGMESAPAKHRPIVEPEHQAGLQGLAQAIPIHWPHWLVGVWWCGIIVCCLRLIRQWFALQGLRQTATPLAADSSWETRFNGLAKRMGVRSRVRLLTSQQLTVPIAIGMFKPAVIVPLAMLSSVPVDQVEALLLHELAHVRRHDYLVNLLQTLIETVFFFHPVVWWISRLIREEREHCCDVVASRAMGDVGKYAGALAALELWRGQSGLGLAQAANGDRAGSLLVRVRRLLSAPSPSTAALHAWQIPLSLIALLVIAVLLFVASNGGPIMSNLTQPASPAENKDVEQVREIIGRYDAEYWKAADVASLVQNKQAAISTDDWWLALLRDKELLVIEKHTGHVAQRHAVQGNQLRWLDDAVLVTDSDGGGSESIQVRRQLLRYVDQRGESLPVNAMVKANIGYLSTGSQWSTWPRRDGVVSLAGLPRSTHWLVPQPHHEVFRVILPLDGDELEQQRYVPSREPSPLSGDDFSVTTHVYKRSYDNAEMVGVGITNLTDKPIHVSEQDIHLETEIEGKQFEVLSPIWRMGEKADFPVVELSPHATSSLGLDWNAWVNQGFWISGGVQLGLGPWPAKQRPGKVWVRVNVRHMGALPVALNDPSHSIIDTAVPQQDKNMELQFLLGESKATPAQFHGIARSTRNPMGWKWIVYLPPGQPLKIFGAIRSIPHVYKVKPRAEDVGYHLDPSSSGRVVQLEASLAVNTDGKWQLTVEADQDIIQGTNLAVWVFHDEQALRIARLVSRQEPVESATESGLNVGQVTTSIIPKLELLSRTFVPQGLVGKWEVGDPLPGYCLWIQAVPDDPVAKDRFTRLTQSPTPSESSRKPDVVQELVLQQLFDQYINVNGKIPTAEVKAAIELVAARGARDRAFMQMVLGELEKRSRADNDRTIRRNLLAVIGKWLEGAGAQRWQDDQALQARNADRAAGQMRAALIHPGSPLLTKVIQLGRLADSSDIDAYVLAVRAAHHPQSEAFLLDVLGNRQAGGDPFEFYKHHPTPPPPETPWPDSMGGSWRDAKFHAAVGLAELGNSRGIEWLIAAVQPNGFGIDGTVFRGTHARAPGGSLRENSAYALADLFGLPLTTTGPEWKAWWQKNKQPTVKGRATLSAR